MKVFFYVLMWCSSLCAVAQTQMLEYDSMQYSIRQKADFSIETSNTGEQPDSNRVKPFKNHQLCLYGFMDSREKIIIQPQYESVKTMKYLNLTFYIVQNQKAGLLDEWGKTVLSQQWDELDTEWDFMGEPWLQCKQKGLLGIINLKGAYVLKPDYQEITRMTEDLFLVKTHTGYGLTNRQQKMILPPKYPKIAYSFVNDYYIVTDTTQQISLIHQSERILIPPFLGNIMVSIAKDSCFYVQRDGSRQYQIFHIQKGWLWDSLDLGDSRLRGAEYTLLRRQKWGLAVGSTLLLPFEYDTLMVLRRDGLMAPFICARNGKWGVFDPSARQWTIPLKYDSLYAFVGDTVLAARLNKSWYLLNLHGERLLADTIEAIGQLLCMDYDYNGKPLTTIFGFIKRQNHLFFYLDERFPKTVSPMVSCAFKKNTDSIGVLYMLDDSIYKSLYINHLGLILIPENYTNIVLTSDSVLATNPAGQRILIDKWGNQRLWTGQNRFVKEYPHQNLKIFQDLNTHLYGATTTDGKLVFPFRYTAIQPAQNAPILWAQKRVESYDTFSQTVLDSLQIPDDPRPYFAGKGWRMFDTLGKLLIINGFENSFEFYNGLGVGQTEGKYGVWNTRGQMIIPPVYDLIVQSIAKKFFYLFRRVRENEYRIGFANTAGQIIIDANLMNMSLFSGDYALVQVGDAIGLINQFGQFVIAPSPNHLRNSALNWVEKMDILNELNDTWIGNEQMDRFFSESLFDFKDTLKQSLFKLDSTMRTAILNLLGTAISSKSLIFSNTHRSPFHTLYNLHNYSSEYRFEDLCETIETNRLYAPIRFEHVEIKANRVHLMINALHLRQYYTYERVGTVWQQLFLKDFVDLKASNRAGLNTLIQQQLEQLKFVPLDCSDPSQLIDLMEHQCYIQEDGIQCFMKNNHSIKLTWERLRPFLKAQ